jgi:calcyclin binding protein
MANVEELQLDIEDLNRLLQVSVRPRVKDLLAAEIKKCELAIFCNSSNDPGVLPMDTCDKLDSSTVASEQAGTEAAGNQAAANQAAVNQVAEVAATQTAASQEGAVGLVLQATTVVPPKYYKDITNYAWDQSDTYMKIYISLPGLKGFNKDNIKSEYTDKSFRLKVENLDDKNYQCHVGFLWGKIVAADCYHKLKSDSILVMLKKAEQKKTWPFVTEREGKEDKKKKSKLAETKDKDPSESLMGLLQQMYNDGDDEMKRTIAKSWTESRNKGGGAGDMGMGGLGGDF